MKKYFIAILLLSGLMQGESEAVDFDMLLAVKEIKIISSKYYNCVEIKDDKQRLLCFDGLTEYINEREKKYANPSKFRVSKDDSINKYKEKFRVIKKELGIK
tara:strand:- start:169 stop:474 length:306 start_codon:yes stop_codon:yes gene_type:complete